MIVALRATDREAEPRGAHRVHAIDDVEVEIFGVDDAALVAGHHVAHEAGGDLLVARGARQQIAGELLDRELIERFVGVEGVDHPLAPEPHLAQRIIVIAAGVAVSREVQPRQREPLTEVRRGEQAIDRSVHCGLWITDCGLKKVGHFRDAWRQADEIERQPADQARRLLRRRRSHVLTREFLQNESVDRIANR